MKIGILTMEQYEGRSANSVGSSRIRGTWLTKHWPEAEIFKIGKKYDVVIFQKAYHLEFMKVFPGIKILDMCDPDWLEGRHVKEAAELCQAITTSSEALAQFMRQITAKPVVCIPDRIDITVHQEKKVHEGQAHSAVWFGYHNNHSVLDGCLLTLKRLGLGLTVISDMPYYPQASVAGIDDAWLKKNLKNVKYDQESINEEIISGGEILLNPRPENGKFKYKSENKTYIGWALGIPVAKDSEDMEKFMEPEARKAEAELRLKEVLEKWTTEKSVAQYQELIKSLNDQNQSKN